MGKDGASGQKKQHEQRQGAGQGIGCVEEMVGSKAGEGGWGRS